MNVDHAYEISIIGNFFDTMVNAGSFICQEFNDFFMAPDTSNNGQARLQIIWDQIPSVAHPEFVGTDKDLNNAKGKNFDGDGWQMNQVTDEERLPYLNIVAATIDMTHIPAVAAMFRKTNQDFYDAFLAIDGLPAPPQGCKPQPPNGLGWADSYSSFMSHSLSTVNNKVFTRISQMANSQPVGTGPKPPSYFQSPTMDKNGQLNALGKGRGPLIMLSALLIFVGL